LGGEDLEGVGEAERGYVLGEAWWI
jgi:hypothetical protein